jgi:hypothetical protein
MEVIHDQTKLSAARIIAKGLFAFRTLRQAVITTSALKIARSNVCALINA